MRAETAESQPDPVGAEHLSRLGLLVPGPAQVIDQDRGQPQLRVGDHDERGPPVGGLGAGQAGRVQAQVHLAEPVEVLVIRNS